MPPPQRGPPALSGQKEAYPFCVSQVFVFHHSHILCGRESCDLEKSVN